MADFRVAHLSFGQTDVASACAQLGARIIPVELFEKGSRREKGCIAVFLAFVRAAWINAPAIKNDKHYRTRHTWRILPMNEKIDKPFFRLQYGICDGHPLSLGYAVTHRPPLQGR